MGVPDDTLVESVIAAARPLTATGDLAELIDAIGDARLVLIGEATHGTHDFYRLRARLTQHLIRDHDFTAIAAEADWPNAYRANRYVHGHGRDPDAATSLSGFRRFPTWMWRNGDVLELLGWLRAHNERRPLAGRCGFYGLDLYSLHSSIGHVLRYLEEVDPAAARRARYRYGCFEDLAEEPQAYGYAAQFDLGRRCEDEVVAQLVDQIRHRAALAAQGDDDEAAFDAEQNARVVANAEEYYRGMFSRRVSSWNLRDTHMADTLDALLVHLDRRAPSGRAKVVVWAHNSHVGDARATEAGDAGEIDIGQLMRERHPGDAVLIGFSTYTGTVTAASEWDGPAEHMRVVPGLAGSWEDVLHRARIPRFWLVPAELEGAARPRLHRAIGVIYRPDTERISHYFHTRLDAQFDILIHLDHTRAVEPLEAIALPSTGEVREPPETYPTGV
jgi:erythromycin esterase-like protein